MYIFPHMHIFIRFVVRNLIHAHASINPSIICLLTNRFVEYILFNQTMNHFVLITDISFNLKTVK